MTADKLWGIHWPVARPKAVEIIQVAGELEIDREASQESDSESEEKGEKCL